MLMSSLELGIMMVQNYNSGKRETAGENLGMR